MLFRFSLTWHSTPHTVGTLLAYPLRFCSGVFTKYKGIMKTESQRASQRSLCSAGSEGGGSLVRESLQANMTA